MLRLNTPLRSHRLTLLTHGALLILFSWSLLACSSASSRSKRRLGMKSHFVNLSSLGADYKVFRGSSLDPFDASPKVKRARGSATVLIKYYSYKLRELDVTLRRGNQIYGAYRFARFAVDRFEADLAKVLGGGWRRMSAAEIGAQLAVVKERHPTRYRSLRNSHSATLLAVRVDQSLVKQARALHQELKARHSSAVKTLKSSPRRSLLIGDMARDVQRLYQRFRRIESGAPRLAKQLGGLKGVITALAVVF